MLVGLCTDICVISTPFAEGLSAGDPDYGGCRLLRGGDAGKPHRTALEAMKACQIRVEGGGMLRLRTGSGECGAVVSRELRRE